MPPPTPTNTGGRLLIASGARVVNLLLHIAVAFFMTPILVHSLGDRMYGLWTVVSAFTGYYGLLDLGIQSAVCRYVANALSRSDLEDQNRIVSTSIAVLSVIALGVLLFSLAAARAFPFFFAASPDASLVCVLIVLLGTRVALSFPFRVFAGLLAANLRYDLTSLAAATRLLLTNGLILLALRQGRGVVAISVICLLGTVVECLLWTAFSYATYRELSIRLRFYARDTRAMVLTYSWKTFVVQVAGILRLKLNALIIGAFLNVGLVTYYAIGERLANYFIELISSLIGNLSPVFSRFETQGRATLLAHFELLTRISIVPTVLAGASMLFYGRPFINRWMGHGFDSSFTVLAILTVPLIIDLMQTPTVGLLYGVSKHHLTAILAVIGGLTNLCLTLAWVRPYGMYGVASASALSIVLVKAILQPLFVCRAMGFSLSRYYLKTLGLPVICTLLPNLLYFWAVRRLLQPDYGRLCLLGLGQCLSALPLAAWFSLTRHDKSVLAEVLARGLTGTRRVLAGKRKRAPHDQ